jgi:hypothetical protein
VPPLLDGRGTPPAAIIELLEFYDAEFIILNYITLKIKKI